MEPLGGMVFRRSLAEVNQQVHNENVAAMKADLAQMKAEHAQGRADQKAKLREKIDALDSRIQAQLEKAKVMRDAEAAQAKVKADVQSVKAAAARAKAS